MHAERSVHRFLGESMKVGSFYTGGEKNKDSRNALEIKSVVLGERPDFSTEKLRMTTRGLALIERKNKGIETAF